MIRRSTAKIRKTFSGRGAALKIFSGSVAIQAVTSASSFLVGLLLIRRTADVQYGYYVLITTAMMLITGLQFSFIGPPMIVRLTPADKSQRADLIGSLHRSQRRLLPWFALPGIVTAIILSISGKLDLTLAATLFSGTVAIIAALNREFFRMVLFAYQRPNSVLRADCVYCMLLIAGAYLATLTPLPAAVAALTMAVASIVGSMLLSRMLWNYEPWNPQAPLGILREIAPVGSWSAFGGAVHWMFSQGYNYIVAGSLDVSAVAALAATRLLVMPVNLLSSGIGNQLLPSVSRWMQSRKPAAVYARLALAATGLACLSCCYLAIMWFGRAWIFHDVLKKSFLHRDQLLMVWCVISIVMVYRDQLLHFLVVRTSFRVTSSLTLLSAIIATTISLLSMPRIGAIGALIGLLTGEVINVLGIAGMSLREVRLMNASARVAHPA